jgi:hypothetical protein
VSDDLPPSSQPGTLSFTFPWSRSPSYESKHASLSPVPSLSYPHPSHASTRRRRIRGPNWTRLIKSFAPAFAGVIVGCEMTLFSQLKDSKRWIEMMGGVRQEEFTKSEFGTDDKLGGMLMVGQIVGAGSAMVCRSSYSAIEERSLTRVIVYRRWEGSKTSHVLRMLHLPHRSLNPSWLLGLGILLRRQDHNGHFDRSSNSHHQPLPSRMCFAPSKRDDRLIESLDDASWYWTCRVTWRTMLEGYRTL